MPQCPRLTKGFSTRNIGRSTFRYKHSIKALKHVSWCRHVSVSRLKTFHSQVSASPAYSSGQVLDSALLHRYRSQHPNRELRDEVLPPCRRVRPRNVEPRYVSPHYARIPVRPGTVRPKSPSAPASANRSFGTLFPTSAEPRSLY